MSGTGSTADRVTARVNELRRDGRSSEIEAALAAFDPAELSVQEQQTRVQWLAAAAGARGDRKESLRLYSEAADQHPDSHAMRFGLAQELLHFGRTQQAFELLDGCKFHALSARHVMVATQQAYLWGEFDRGLGWLDLIVKTYEQLGVVEPTGLITRGLPDFFQTWGALGALHELRGSLDTFEDYTRQAANTLRGYNFGVCTDLLDGVRSGDYARLLAGLTRTEAAMREQGLPDGLPRAQAAVIAALSRPDADAEALLDTITMTERDAPWLDDMGVLAEAAVARRAGDDDTEATLRADFLRRQPRLFEPQWAFSFRVLEYQESLRGVYQEQCAARGRADPGG